MTKKFPIDVVLTAFTGMCVCKQCSDMHPFVEFIMGRRIWTHELPLVIKEVRGLILAQHPELAGAKPFESGAYAPARIVVYLAEVSEQFGSELEFKQGSTVREHSPFETLATVRGGDRRAS